MPDPQFLYDERVALVPLAEHHADTMVQWVNDQAVVQHLGMTGGMSLAEERAWIAGLPANPRDRVFGILLRAGERLIGSVALHGVGGTAASAEYGISIGDKQSWGQGYGTAAGRLILDWGFNRLNLHSIHLRVHANNPRGMASYRKLGFQDAGELREATFRNGQYIGIRWMDLLAREFNALHADWRKAQAERYGL